MKIIWQFLKKFQIGKMVTVLAVNMAMFVGVILGVSTQSEALELPSRGYYEARAEAMNAGGYYQRQVGMNDAGAVAGSYSKQQGGMNDYSDVDPRQDTRAADQKTQAMIKRAEQNLEKRADSVEQYAENYRSGAPLPERTQRLAKNLNEGIEQAGEDAKNVGKKLAGDYKRAGNNLQRNVGEAADDLKQGSKTASAKLQDAAKDLGRGTSGMENVGLRQRQGS